MPQTTQNRILNFIKIRLLNSEEISTGGYIKIKPFEDRLRKHPLLLEILETYLSNFSCINNHTTIPLLFDNEEYSINIIDTKPSDKIYIVNVGPDSNWCRKRETEK